MGTTLQQWLGELGQADLQRLLEQRADAIHPPLPRDLGELADRLEHPASLLRALAALGRPAVQTLEALAALGGRGSVDQLQTLLDAGHSTSWDEHVAAVAGQLRHLQDAGLCRPLPGGGLETSPLVAHLVGSEQQFGPPVRALLLGVTADGLRQLLRTRGVRPVGAKAALVERVAEVLTDAEATRSLLRGAAPAVRETLLQTALGQEDEGNPYDPENYRRRAQAGRWAVEYGLAFPLGWGSNQWIMPAEVQLALLGAHFRLPFEPHPPPVARSAVSVEAVTAESAASATAFAELATSLLDLLNRQPVPALKSGGLGVREVARLAKAVAAPETSTRLALELALRSRLLDVSHRVTVSDGFAAWRAREPGERYAVLVRAWWLAGDSPSEQIGDDGRTMPALRAPGDCPGCRQTRRSALRVLTAGGEGQGLQLAGFGELLRWAQAMAHGTPSDRDQPFSTVWREAHLLGVAALGALGPIGRALVQPGTVLGESGDALGHAASEALPAATDRAVFGADLTAVAVGPPSARVSAVLDFCAEREGRGGATTWRFSPASIRRALDEGGTPDSLLADLATVAGVELPQPLRYLVGDVARRHGVLRVHDAVSMITSTDEALLAEVSVDKRLRRLDLRLVAPTVLACGVPVDEALSAIRAAGYFPMPAQERVEAPPAAAREDVVTSFAAQLRQAQGSRRERRKAERPVDAQVAAAGLVGRLSAPRLVSRTQTELARHTRRLNETELRLLAEAIDTGGPVVIQYESGGGSVSVREITGIEHSVGTVFAWCPRHNDDRTFSLARICSVAPAV
ncbi:MAG TPA: helicase-associated domain-containing protein [Dermatophilaceae bacterium]|nr:helicase-associated domain-containing protein [Dermatophilaceae bacterium]